MHIWTKRVRHTQNIRNISRGIRLCRYNIGEEDFDAIDRQYLSSSLSKFVHCPICLAAWISSFHPFFRGKVDARITRSNRVTETGHCQCQSCLPSFYSSFSFTHRAQLLPASGLAFHFFFFRTMPTLSPAISSIHVEEEARWGQVDCSLRICAR